MTYLDAISWFLLLSGGFFCVVGGFGMLRMPDFYTRMHAASLTDTLGAAGILLGLMLQSGPNLVTIKLIIISAFLLITSPTASHALVKAAYATGVLWPEEDPRRAGAPNDHEEEA